MTYQLGRWFRRLIKPAELSRVTTLPLVDPNDLTFVLEESWSRLPLLPKNKPDKSLLIAPVLMKWFIYTPEERTKEVTSRNYTCSDIRWFLGCLTTPFGERSRVAIVRQDQLMCWTRLPMLVSGNMIPARENPEHEWIVYMTWVQYVLTRAPTVQKMGRLRMRYRDWFKRYFPHQEDPLGLC